MIIAHLFNRYVTSLPYFSRYLQNLYYFSDLIFLRSTNIQPSKSSNKSGYHSFPIITRMNWRMTLSSGIIIFLLITTSIISASNVETSTSSNSDATTTASLPDSSLTISPILNRERLMQINDRCLTGIAYFQKYSRLATWKPQTMRNRMRDGRKRFFTLFRMAWGFQIALKFKNEVAVQEVEELYGNKSRFGLIRTIAPILITPTVLQIQHNEIRRVYNWQPKLIKLTTLPAKVDKTSSFDKPNITMSELFDRKVDDIASKMGYGVNFSPEDMKAAEEFLSRKYPEIHELYQVLNPIDQSKTPVLAASIQRNEHRKASTQRRENRYDSERPRFVYSDLPNHRSRQKLYPWINLRRTASEDVEMQQ